ncbi:hypothetical protein SERLA73DRAFT_129868 [Serpula lacrymans var. lacrymans S7.3]|uniref:Uncharacterized protein n=1 Tax=Serpula lacrymans var. lacrymans (strain S7.3) TaxID=936435 RepID=F8PK73_SERL3|nr:hypothetical protein SERLA73DRAFT_129868 [Serpula lacrymans var. lacrymans S7.3]
MVKTSDVLLILVAILFPPASVAFITGCSCDLLINILLTILGYFPGHIHAFWLIYKKMKAEERYGRGGFLYTGNGQYAPLNQGGYNQGYVPGQVNYGATN